MDVPKIKLADGELWKPGMPVYFVTDFSTRGHTLKCGVPVDVVDDPLFYSRKHFSFDGFDSAIWVGCCYQSRSNAEGNAWQFRLEGLRDDQADGIKFSDEFKQAFHKAYDIFCQKEDDDFAVQRGIKKATVIELLVNQYGFYYDLGSHSKTKYGHICTWLNDKFAWIDLSCSHVYALQWELTLQMAFDGDTDNVASQVIYDNHTAEDIAAEFDKKIKAWEVRHVAA